MHAAVDGPLAVDTSSGGGDNTWKLSTHIREPRPEDEQAYHC